MRRPYTDMPRQDRDSVPGRFMGTVVFVRATMIGDHLRKSAVRHSPVSGVVAVNNRGR